MSYLEDVQAISGTVATVPGQVGEIAKMSPDKALRAVLPLAWSAMPISVGASFRSLATDLVTSLPGAGAAIDAALTGVGAASAIIGPLIQGMEDAQALWVDTIRAIQKTNDDARWRARRDFWRRIAEGGPNVWVESPWMRATYKRTRGLDKAKHPLIYPAARATDADSPFAEESWGPFANGPSPKHPSDGCAGGGSDFSGGRGDCNGYFKVWPVFGPVWITEALGWGNKSLKGMERSPNGGGDIFGSIVAMQLALLGDPLANMQANGNLLLEVWRRFDAYFWDQVGNPPQNLSPFAPNPGPGLWQYGENPGWAEIEVDPEFNPSVGPPSPTRNRFYRSPGGYVGAYLPDGTGSLSSEALRRVGVPRWRSKRFDDAGGNNITAADYNVVRASVAGFFAQRAHLLGRPAYLRDLVNTFPGLFQKRVRQLPNGAIVNDYPIPDKELRGAIVEESKKRPTGVAVPRWERPTRLRQAVIDRERKGKGGGGGLLVAGGLAAGGFMAWKLLKR